MTNVEVDAHGKNTAVKNLKSMIVMRALQIQREMGLGKSWKVFFKCLWYKILGKSLAWEEAVKETKAALMHEKNQKNPGELSSSWKFLKSPEGWGEAFQAKAAELFRQPY